MLPVLQHPYDLFVRGDFDQLRTFAGAAAGSENRVAVGQSGASLRRLDEPVSLRQVGVLEFPNRFAFRIHFARETVLLISDQGVSVLQPDGSPRRFNRIAPDFIKIFVVFHDVARTEIGKEIRSLRGVARATGLTMNAPGIERLAVGAGHLMIYLHRAGLGVDDHQPRRHAAHDDHHSVQTDGLAGVNFRVIGAAAVVAIVTPDHFLVRSDFGDILHPGEEDVAVGKHPHVVVFPARAGLISPDHLAVVDEKHLGVILPDIKHRVLGEAVARKTGGRDRGRPFANGRLDFGRTERGHVGGGKTCELGHAWRCRGRTGGGTGRVTAGCSSGQANSRDDCNHGARYYIPIS